MPRFADVIIDISHEQLDKTFQYIIPESLYELVNLGVEVVVPFGKSNREISGFVVNVTSEASFEVSKMKEIKSVAPKGVTIESQLIQLAAWIKENCGSTMIQALKTVLPVKKKIQERTSKTIELIIPKDELEKEIAEFARKKNVARVRLLTELLDEPTLDYELATGKLNVSPATIKGLVDRNIISVRTEIVRRNPVIDYSKERSLVQLNDEQQLIVDSITNDTSDVDAYLIHGITGSGKTEVYIELIYEAVKRGKQAIVLIPEIALTFQTVKRFKKRFGDRVSIMNSRLSQGERYDQFEKAKSGEVDVIIGPRSALFTPFSNLGLIVIDEEHESSYKSETVPRYHAKDVAIARAKMCNAKVVLGSATPSVDSYYAAECGRYKLFELTKRATGSSLADVEVVDMREELRNGNRSIISDRLNELICDRLKAKEQIMLFINRRGYQSFVSCRSCGTAVKCPHCDVALSEHNGFRLVCHYCGYEETFVKKCKKCGSPYVAGFKAGTQKIEKLINELYPSAKTLRMDADTTKGKEGHSSILSSFANHEVDILIGTQMIVKGHDFSNVTLVGVLAADLSLYSSDFMSNEKTFQLITQAAGRAGRGDKPGQVIIQTYSPENNGIVAASNQDYESFYKSEIMFRDIMNYPPVAPMLLIVLSSEFEDNVKKAANSLSSCIDKDKCIHVLGPCDAPISKVKDQYKQVIYIKGNSKENLVLIKNELEHFIREGQEFKTVSIIFDFNPLSIF